MNKQLFILFILILSSKYLFPITFEKQKASQVQTNIDTVNTAGNKFDHYLYMGIGIGFGKSLTLNGYMIGYSLAFKSNVISINYSGNASYILGENEYADNFECNYFAILFGRAARKGKSLYSISAGFANSGITYFDYTTSHNLIQYKKNGLTFPVEGKILYFNPLGSFKIGFSASFNIVPKYTSSLFALMLVWNLNGGRTKNPRHNSNNHKFFEIKVYK